MRRVKSARYTPAAFRDFDTIWDYTTGVWGSAQAETYLHGLSATVDTLCRHPEIARERPEFDPPVRLHPYRLHLIIYRTEGDALTVIRVVHTRQNWRGVLEE